ncbi:RIMS-binding protein 2 isoform X3 [Parasteatoda tepidariorum]|uniref:RIMS-binding protein 2 isoform X3 n=1 Tax=Parasteatoda tepidariorum TaxID=114398 RepID=UPI001C71C2E5|nr:RIMS-binding protein 2 isoform X2 [Parasteatoda tepidariorum]
MENIQSLESEIRELGKKCDLESVLREELNLEIQTLQRKKSFQSSTQEPISLEIVSDQSVQTVVQSVAGAPKESYQPITSVKYSIEGPIVAEVALIKETENSASCANQNKTNSETPSENTNSEINRILARIEQDNQILAELEKSRGTVDLPLVGAATKENKERPLHVTSIKQSVTRHELDQLMAKLEQDNRILAELDKKRNILETSLSKKTFMTNNGLPSPSPSLGNLRDPSFTLQSLTASASATSLLHPFQRIQSDVALTEEEMLDSIDFIELPGRGRCHIYCARYTYDPLKQSPNENPEAELLLNAGDYVIIYGEMDEDGFFNGELLDGRKGLVPSNFVEKLTGEELFEFHATILYGNRDSDESSVSFSYAQDIEVSDDFLQPEDFHRMNDYVDLDDIEEVDQDNDEEDVQQGNENFAFGVPPPQRLILERQMNKSLLIGWVPPDVAPGKIEGYHVYVDGIPKATIQFSERTRALIEGVDSSKPHRISVRSISSAGFHSKDAACTIVVGKDFPLAPTCVKASYVTASSALISWLPSNSNFQHVIAVNSVEVKVVKPGCFRHHVTGLSPNTVYRVSVRVKPGKLLYNDEKNPKKLEMLVSNVEFRTLPKGLPDPPVNVSVEQGPQDGSILITWLPVLTNPASTLISPVTGYAVFAAGKKIAEIDSPSGDHALIDGQQLLALNKKSITVKSKSVDGFSNDSLVCTVPNELLRNAQKSVILKRRMFDERRRSSSSDSESDTELTELLNHVNRRARAFDPSTDSPFSSKGDVLEEMQHEAELSDIVEEEEEPAMDTSKSKMLCKVESINDVECEAEEMTKNSARVQESVRRMNQNQMPNQRRQEWKNQSYNTRSMSEGHRNRQIVLDLEENLSDKEMYPSRPTIASKEAIQNHKIPRETTVLNDAENIYSEEEYNQRRRHRTSSPEKYSGAPSRPLRTESDTNYSSNSHRGPHSQHIHSQYSHRDRRQSHDSNQAVSEKQRQQLQDQNRRNHTTSRGGQPTPPNHSYSNNRRSLGNSSRKLADFQEPISRYGDYNTENEEGHNRVRFFVALFDYDPQTMSPNPDAADEELPFQEGQMIKIYGDKDSDGFYRGESNGRVGLVPGNMVSEVQIDGDPFNDNNSRGDRRIKKMVAIYDYDPQEISPNVDSEVELSFSIGDVIYVIGEVDEDGFYIGELNGAKGLVPSNFLRPIEEELKQPKGASRDEYQHRKTIPETLEYDRKSRRNSDYESQESAITSFSPPSTLWDEFDGATRVPHIPSRGQRLGPNFAEPDQAYFA